MMDKPKISALEFLDRVAVREDGSHPDKETIFKAYYDARGTAIEDSDFPFEVNNPLACHVNGARSSVFIRRCEAFSKKGELSIKPTNRDFLEVAKSAFIKAHGKPESFRAEMKNYKPTYEAGRMMSQISSRKAQNSASLSA